MKTTHRPRVLFTGITIFAAAFATLAAAKPTQAPTPSVLTAMQDELDRSMAAMSKGDPADYFISYTVADREYSEVSGSNGALLTSGETRALAGSPDARGHLSAGRHAQARRPPAQLDQPGRVRHCG